MVAEHHHLIAPAQIGQDVAHFFERVVCLGQLIAPDLLKRLSVDPVHRRQRRSKAGIACVRRRRVGAVLLAHRRPALPRLEHGLTRFFRRVVVGFEQSHAVRHIGFLHRLGHRIGGEGQTPHRQQGEGQQHGLEHGETPGVRGKIRGSGRGP